MPFRRAWVLPLLLLIGPRAEALEPWADAHLPAVPGLAWWLDATRIQVARASLGLPPLDDGAPLPEWHDGSGLQRRATQSVVGQRPRLVRIAANESVASLGQDPWVVRFDGQDDALRVTDFNLRTRDFTLFVVAAPHSNLGLFRGLVAFHAHDQRDYESGWTLDLNATGSTRLQELNLEGRGFGGATNLLRSPAPFGTLKVLEATADATGQRVRLDVDGQTQGDRPFLLPADEQLVADGAVLGARFYENGRGPQRVQGFLHGDIVEVLLYQRVLSEEERKAVRAYLAKKHSRLREILPRAARQAESSGDVEPLVAVPDAPLVQMLVPGFRVSEVPIALSNVNNLRVRSDGRVYALGYSGDVWLLTDRDGDGLPDQSSLFFAGQGKLRGPIGMAVIPAGHKLLRDVTAAPEKEQPTNSHDASRDTSPVAFSTKRPLTGPRGVVVASKGKISALVDVDGDDVADNERILATGWREIPQNVDAVGVAIDPRDGAIYFGLGTAAYNNAYLLDDQGKSAFDLSSERGTIQRIEPDLSRRSTVCTGVRFTIGMAFDAASELFVTDQEGATWLANGNPFDELLHIVPGRHYGFPPRHPRHLPRVFDEPSLFDYRPQHQSTCGLTFNIPSVPDGAIFGPESWRGDLLVCGESRGKLYRTRLARDSRGEYVAANELIACLGMLAVDCCVSPRGDLLVACHGGGPDWGTGPGGDGKIFAIRHEGARLPQPLVAWAASPQELRVAFDRPLDPGQLEDLPARTRINYGEYVAAGDRFETLRPGYAVTQQQLVAPRYKLPVYSASITPDRQTLILSTAPQRAAVPYSLTLPGLGRQAVEAAPAARPLPAPEESNDKVGGEADDASDAVDAAPSPVAEPAATAGEPPALFQHPQIDLAYSLRGVAVSWEARGATSRRWEGWWPHLDPRVSRALSPRGDELAEWSWLDEPGELTLATQFSSQGLFEPALQPGSQLDYDAGTDLWVRERFLVVRCSRPFTVRVGDDKAARASGEESGEHVARVPIERASTRLLPLVLTVPTEADALKLSVSWMARLGDDSERSGAIALERLLLPWARREVTAAASREANLAVELEGGNWGRGRRIFLSDEAGCAKCHVAHGVGGRIGPDLSNLIHRDYASVMRDVAQPSFAINPDYLTYAATLKDGRVLTGAVRSDGDHLLVGNQDARVTRVARSEIEELAPSPLSIMPEGLPQKLGPERMRDLLTFLLREGPRMPQYAPLAAPPPRRRSDVEAVLAGAPDAVSPPGSGPQTEVPRSESPLRVLLIAGAKDHGPGEHDYPAWLSVWSELLSAVEGVEVETAMEWPTEEQVERAGTMVFFQKGSWNAERARVVDAHLARGRGLVYIHWAVEAGAEAPEFARRIGLASEAAKLKYRHGPLDLSFVPPKDHPIARNFDKVHFHDESYWKMQGDARRIRILATGVEDGQPQPLFWTLEPHGGRVFVSILGHYSWTFDDPMFRILLARGIAWTARQPVDRLNDVVWPGVKLAD